MRPTIARRISTLLVAIRNCETAGNDEWLERHTDNLENLIKETAPSGSGFDLGTSFDLEKSDPDKLVFFGSFHHMDENGGYDGWTDHTITARPSFAFGVDVRVSGRNRNDIKEYIGDIFDEWLDATADEV